MRFEQLNTNLLQFGNNIVIDSFEVALQASVRARVANKGKRMMEITLPSKVKVEKQLNAFIVTN
jgi:hypothetical protein